MITKGEEDSFRVESGLNMKPRITSLVAGNLLAFTLFGAATAGPLEDGEAAYGRGDYAAAMRLLRLPAANGSIEPKGISGSCMRRVRVCSRTSARL